MCNTVPEGWMESTIGELTSASSLFSDGDWVESKDQDPVGTNRLIQLADIGDGVFINKSSRFMNDEQFKRLKCTELRPNDVLIARMPDPLGRACLYPRQPMRSATVVDVAILRTTNADHYWLMSAINSADFRYQIDLSASGTTRTRIPRGALSQIKLLAPPLHEQQKIATILSSVDDVIEKTRAQIDKLKDLKTGLMQELLTQGIGHTEFKDSPVGRIPATWTVVGLGATGLWKGGGTPSKARSEYWTGEIPWVSPKDMKCEFISQTEDQITKKAVAESSTNVVGAGSVLVVVRSGILKHTLPVAIAVTDVALNQDMKGLTVNGSFSSLYIYHCLLAESQKILRSTLKAGNTVESLDFKAFGEFLLPCPPLAEQEKIAERIESIARSTRTTVLQLNAYINIKKALMQDLLTGKVRVNVTDKEVAVA